MYFLDNLQNSHCILLLKKLTVVTLWNEQLYKEFAKLRVHLPTCLKLLPAFIFHMPLALNYFVPECAHFSRNYVPTTTQALGTDIYPADVKSDEN